MTLVQAEPILDGLRRLVTTQPAVYARALHRAAEIAGGTDKLREALRVPMPSLQRWLAGHETPPMDVFLVAVDIIAATTGPLNAAPLPDAVQRSRQLRLDSGVLRATAHRNIERALAIRESILAAQLQSASLRPRAAPEFLTARFEPAEGDAMVQCALDAAISGTQARMGNVQLRVAEGLRLVAHRGFERPFLDFFALVDEDIGACGVAMKASRRVVIADVASHPLFKGTAAGQVLAEAQVRAVQSTPLVGVTAQLLGILSTHYDRPHEPSARELEVLDGVAQRATFWLEGGQLVDAIAPGR